MKCILCYHSCQIFDLVIIYHNRMHARWVFFQIEIFGCKCTWSTVAYTERMSNVINIVLSVKHNN